MFGGKCERVGGRENAEYVAAAAVGGVLEPLGDCCRKAPLCKGCVQTVPLYLLFFLPGSVGRCRWGQALPHICLAVLRGLLTLTISKPPGMAGVQGTNFKFQHPAVRLLCTPPLVSHHPSSAFTCVSTAWVVSRRPDHRPPATFDSHLSIYKLQQDRVSQSRSQEPVLT